MAYITTLATCLLLIIYPFLISYYLVYDPSTTLLTLRNIILHLVTLCD